MTPLWAAQVTRLLLAWPQGDSAMQETAEVLKVSQDTVVRDWRFAKAWLQNELIGNK